jgi:hypothetical protein
MFRERQEKAIEDPSLIQIALWYNASDRWHGGETDTCALRV